MAEMTLGEPQSAADYDDRTTATVKTVLIEIGQILASFKGKFAIIGGAVPWLLLSNDGARQSSCPASVGPGTLESGDNGDLLARR